MTGAFWVLIDIAIGNQRILFVCWQETYVSTSTSGPGKVKGHQPKILSHVFYGQHGLQTVKQQTVLQVTAS